MLYGVLVVGITLIVGLAGSAPADADFVAIGKVDQSAVTVNNVTAHDGVVSGEIVNHSSREIRDVELLLRHMWRWHNEFRPGNSDPGTASYHTVDGIIPPGESARFTVKDQSRQTARSDGQFQTTVSVAGFTKIIRNPSGG